jgi:ribonuclease HII
MELGIDEAGRGCWAGHMVVALAAVPEGTVIPGVRDSKKISSAERRGLRNLLIADLPFWAVHCSSPQDIDALGLGVCWDKAVRGLVEVARRFFPDKIIVDGNVVPKGLHNVVSVVRADSLYQSVAAASIIAKVLHDGLLSGHAFPAFSFDKHQGYGTQAHRKELLANGLTPLHRKSFVHFL